MAKEINLQSLNLQRPLKEKQEKGQHNMIQNNQVKEETQVASKRDLNGPFTLATGSTIRMVVHGRSASSSMTRRSPRRNWLIS